MTNSRRTANGTVTVVDQRDNVTLDDGICYRMSSFSQHVARCEPGDHVTIVATQGKSGDLWIDTLQNNTAQRGTVPIPQRFRRNGNTATSAPTPAAQPYTPTIDQVAYAEPTPGDGPTQLKVLLEREHSNYKQRNVHKAFEIAFNYLKDESDADETDAIALAVKLISVMEEAARA